MTRAILNQSIVLRLLLLTLIPLFTLLLLSANNIYEKYNLSSEAVFIEEVFIITPVVSELIHELQEERSRSSGFLSSKGKSFGIELLQEREIVNKAVKNFKLYVKPPEGRLAIKEYASPFNRAMNALLELDKIRQGVDVQAIKPLEMKNYYSNIIKDLIATIESLSAIIKDPVILRHIISYVALIEGKERAAGERSMGTTAFSKGEFTPYIFNNFVSLAASQETYFYTFKHFAAKAEVDYYNKKTSGPEEQHLHELRETANKAPFGQDISQISGEDWFKISTAHINILHDIEKHVIESIRHELEILHKETTNSLIVLSVILMVLLLSVTVLSILVYRSIVPPIIRLVTDMRRLAKNELSIKIAYLTRQDEIGEMARAIDVFKENAIERMRLEEKAGNERDKERHRQTHIEKTIGGFNTALNKRLNILLGQTENMEATSSKLTEVATNASSNAESANNATELASKDVQIVASAASQLASSIKEIEGQTGRVHGAMEDATSQATQTDREVAQLSNAANQIGEVVNLIREIAEKTNLLALNATIEAARAGEAGRGFAIVAAEVKSLATQTADATENIAAQIGAIQTSTGDAVNSIKGIITSVNDVQELTAAVSDAVSQQLEATQEIERSVLSASRETEAVTKSVGHVRETIDITSREANSVRSATEMLNDTIDGFRGEVERFLEDVSKDVHERRAALRVKMKEVVLVNAEGRRLQSEVINVSVTGAAIMPLPNMEVGKAIVIQMANNITLSGKIARVTDELIGVQFDEALESLDPILAEATNDKAA